MSEIFNEANLKLFKSKIFIILNYTVPGIVILEIFFDQGFFSNIPKDLYSFLLYILWAFILSIPFNLIDLVNTEKVSLKYAKKHILKYGGQENDIKKLEEILNENEEYYFEVNAQIHFISIIINSLLIYLIYKYLNSNYEYYTFFGINKNIIIISNVIIIINIIFIPLRLVATAIVSNSFKKEYDKI